MSPETTYVEKKTHRRRIVKGWAFMDLDDKDRKSILDFLATGAVAVLPDSFKAVVDTVVAQKLPKWAD